MVAVGVFFLTHSHMRSITVWLPHPQALRILPLSRNNISWNSRADYTKSTRKQSSKRNKQSNYQTNINQPKPTNTITIESTQISRTLILQAKTMYPKPKVPNDPWLFYNQHSNPVPGALLQGNQELLHLLWTQHRIGHQDVLLLTKKTDVLVTLSCFGGSCGFCIILSSCYIFWGFKVSTVCCAFWILVKLLIEGCSSSQVRCFDDFFFWCGLCFFRSLLGIAPLWVGWVLAGCSCCLLLAFGVAASWCFSKCPHFLDKGLSVS